MELNNNWLSLKQQLCIHVVIMIKETFGNKSCEKIIEKEINYFYGTVIGIIIHYLNEHFKLNNGSKWI